MALLDLESIDPVDLPNPPVGTILLYADLTNGDAYTQRTNGPVDTPLNLGRGKDVPNTPAALVATPVNDFDPAGFTAAQILRLQNSLGANVDVTGMNGEGGTPAKRNVMMITNIGGADTITLKHQSGLSVAANRFFFSTLADVVVGPNGDSFVVWYDEVVGFWRNYA